MHTTPQMSPQKTWQQPSFHFWFLTKINAASRCWASQWQVIHFPSLPTSIWLFKPTRWWQGDSDPRAEFWKRIFPISLKMQTWKAFYQLGWSYKAETLAAKPFLCTVWQSALQYVHSWWWSDYLDRSSVLSSCCCTACDELAPATFPSWPNLAQASSET